MCAVGGSTGPEDRVLCVRARARIVAWSSLPGSATLIHHFGMLSPHLSFSSYEKITLQLFLAFRSGSREGGSNLNQIYFSTALSMVSVGYNIYRVRDGARKSQKRVLEYVVEILQVGVGHIPHIAGIREGKLKVADFSTVPAKLLMENEAHGLKRIFDAMEDGKSLEKVIFSCAVAHDLRDLVDLSENRELPEEVTVTLGKSAREPEGKFLSTLLEARGALTRVRIVLALDEEAENGEGELRAADAARDNDVENEGRKSLGINTALRALSGKTEIFSGLEARLRDEEDKDLGAALAHIVSTFLLHRHDAVDARGWNELDLSSVSFPKGAFKRFAQVLHSVLEDNANTGPVPRASLMRNTQLRRKSVKRAPLPNVAVLLGFQPGFQGGMQGMNAVAPQLRNRTERNLKVIKLDGRQLGVEDFEALLGRAARAPMALIRMRRIEIEGLPVNVIGDLLSDGFKWDQGIAIGMLRCLPRDPLRFHEQLAEEMRDGMQQEVESTATRFCVKGTRPVDVSEGGKLLLTYIRSQMRADVHTLDLSPCSGLHASFLRDLVKTLAAKNLRKLREIVLGLNTRIRAASAGALGNAFKAEVLRWENAEERLDRLGQRWVNARRARKARELRAREEERMRLEFERQRLKVEERRKRAREAAEARDFEVNVAYCVIVVGPGWSLFVRPVHSFLNFTMHTPFPQSMGIGIGISISIFIGMALGLIQV